MPKILENVRENLLKEAKRQVFENGYSALTIRSVAGACGIGIGTVYNYFTSKDMLVASFLLEDWQACLDAIGAKSEQSENVEPVLREMYDELQAFAKKYEVLFKDENARESFAGTYQLKHKLIREQLAAPFSKFCRDQTNVSANFLAEFVAESMLTWGLEAGNYEELSKVLLQLFL